MNAYTGSPEIEYGAERKGTVVSTLNRERINREMTEIDVTRSYIYSKNIFSNELSVS